jgi:hypothetical protein
MASTNIDQAQKIPFSDLAKQAFKETVLEVVAKGEWTDKADKLAESFIHMMIMLGKKREGENGEKGKQ